MSDPGDIDLNLPYGSPSQFGTLTGWNSGDATITETKQVATTEDEYDDVTAAKEYDTKTEVTQPFKAAALTAPDLPEYCGDILGGKLVTKISIKTKATDFVEMELTGHNHAVNAHAANSDHRLLEHGITLDSGFGAKNFLGATLGDECTIESADLDIEINHDDILNGLTGNHFAGNNYHGHLTCTMVFRGVPTSFCDASWTVIPSKATGKKKNTYASITVKAEKWIALDV